MKPNSTPLPATDHEAIYRNLRGRVRRRGPRRWSKAWRLWIEAGDFAESLAPWGYFVTATTKRPMSASALAREAQRWADRLALLADEHVRVLFAIEAENCGETHLHALVERVPAVTCRDVACEWRVGHCQAKAFQPNVGGAHYVVKDGAWDVLLGCPRHARCKRRGGCVGKP